MSLGSHYGFDIVFEAHDMGGARGNSSADLIQIRGQRYFSRDLSCSFPVFEE